VNRAAICSQVVTRSQHRLRVLHRLAARAAPLSSQSPTKATLLFRLRLHVSLSRSPTPASLIRGPSTPAARRWPAPRVSYGFPFKAKRGIQGNKGKARGTRHDRRRRPHADIQRPFLNGEQSARAAVPSRRTARPAGFPRATQQPSPPALQPPLHYSGKIGHRPEPARHVREIATVPASARIDSGAGAADGATEGANPTGCKQPPPERRTRPLTFAPT